MAAGERRSTSGNAVTTSPVANFNSAASSFVVADATGYPDGTNGPFFVKVDSETIKITGRTGTTFNVQTTPVTGRGWENTSAASHTTSSVVNFVFTSTDADNANEHYASVAVDHHTQYLNITRHDSSTRHPASVLPLGAPGSSAPGDTANAGTAASVARSDHRHGREADSTTRVGCTLSAGTPSIPAVGGATVSWTTETVDTDGFIASPSNTITIPSGKGGVYAITVWGQWSSVFSEKKLLRVNTTLGVFDYSHPVGVVNTGLSAGTWNWSLTIPLAATNTIQVSLYHDNASAQATTANIAVYRVAA